MRYTEEQMAEMDILIRYNLQSTQQGIKVHSRANKEQIAAVQRLFDKGLVTAVDGLPHRPRQKSSRTRTGAVIDTGATSAQHGQLTALDYLLPA